MQEESVGFLLSCFHLPALLLFLQAAQRLLAKRFVFLCLCFGETLFVDQGMEGSEHQSCCFGWFLHSIFSSRSGTIDTYA